MQTWLFRWNIQRSSFKWETHHKFTLVQVRRPTMNWYNKYNLRSEEAGILDNLKGSSDALMFWNKLKNVMNDYAALQWNQIFGAVV